MYTPDPSLSVPATTRWKGATMQFTNTRFTIVEQKHLHRLVTTQQASKFLNLSATPSLETPKISRNEEIREISLQLVSLKKKHDVSKNRNIKNQLILDTESKFRDKFKGIKTRTLLSLQDYEAKTQALERQYQVVKLQQDEALSAKKVYKHILNRMRMTKIKFEEQSLDLTKQLRENDIFLRDEQYRSRKSNETKIQTKSATIFLWKPKKKCQGWII
jgi:hypothetical protein